jgi:hypothetical protein
LNIFIAKRAKQSVLLVQISDGFTNDPAPGKTMLRNVVEDFEIALGELKLAWGIGIARAAREPLLFTLHYIIVSRVLSIRRAWPLRFKQTNRDNSSS